MVIFLIIYILYIFLNHVHIVVHAIAVNRLVNVILSKG